MTLVHPGNAADTGDPDDYDRMIDAARDKADGITPDTGDEEPEHVGPRIWRATDLRPAAPLRWLARGRLPSGSVSLLVGDEGIGKSLWWCWLVAAITTGRALPEIGLPARDPADVLLVFTEDEWAPTVLPRLEVAGVDIDRITVICEEDDGSGSPLFPNHMHLVEEAAERIAPALVVVDAWLDTVPGDFNVKDPHGARRALHPWRDFAGHHDAAVLLLTHTNRVASGSARDKYGITAELRKKARMTLFAQQDEDTGELIIGPEKSNLVGEVPASRFTIRPVQYFDATEDTDGTVPELVYMGEHEQTARDIIATKFEEESGTPADDRTEAEKWLHDVLVVNGKMPSADVKTDARKEGIAERTLKRAARNLRIKYDDEGFPRRTWWTLPDDHRCEYCPEPGQSGQSGQGWPL